jgi:hypothetical protein
MTLPPSSDQNDMIAKAKELGDQHRAIAAAGGNVSGVAVIKYKKPGMLYGSSDVYQVIDNSLLDHYKNLNATVVYDSESGDPIARPDAEPEE